MAYAAVNNFLRAAPTVQEPETEESGPATGLISLNYLQQIEDARSAALAAYEAGAAQLVAGYTTIQEARKLAGIAHGGHGFYRDSTNERGHIDRLGGKDFDAEASLAAVRRSLDAAIWTRLLEQTGLRDMMDKKERDDFDSALRGDNVPEATRETITATFQRLCGEADLIFQRGLARAFSSLDRRFRSHDGFKIGARVIIDRLMSSDFGSWSYGSNMEGTFIDLERIFAILDGRQPAPGALRRAIEADRPGWGPKQSETVTRYFKVRVFKNGNAHLWFERPELVAKVNAKLAEYYGAALPDAAPADASPDIFRNRTNLPAKDLAFYPTPAAVAEEALHSLYIRPGMKVLEPSAGTGGLVAPLVEKGCLVDAIEIHPERAAMLAGRNLPGVTVRCANFLGLTPREDYDLVVMNPPFAGTHWMDHVMQGWAFLNPGGTLVAILPASAEVNETPKHERFRAWAGKMCRDRWGRMFRDLPPESFREVGVNINTVVLTMKK
jgi:protein-L-isoaspartate O-methyltransferase